MPEKEVLSIIGQKIGFRGKQGQWREVKCDKLEENINISTDFRSKCWNVLVIQEKKKN